MASRLTTNWTTDVNKEIKRQVEALSTQLLMRSHSYGLKKMKELNPHIYKYCRDLVAPILGSPDGNQPAYTGMVCAFLAFYFHDRISDESLYDTFGL